MTTDAQTMAMFIDYDNVERAVRQHGVEAVIRTVLRTMPEDIFAPWNANFDTTVRRLVPTPPPFPDSPSVEQGHSRQLSVRSFPNGPGV